MALHQIGTNNFPENPDKWGRELSEKIEMEIFLFNDHYHALESKNLALEGEQDFAGIPRLQNLSIDERKRVVYATLTNNTFLSMFRDLVIYIDKVLSLYLWTKKTQKNPISVAEIQDLSNFLEEQPLEEYKKFTRGFSKFPEKLEILSNLNMRSKERLKGYNDLRVSFEHHGGIAKKDILFPISSIEVDNNSEGMVPAIIRLDLPIFKTFKKDEKIILKPQDVSVIGYDIKGWIIKDILLAIDTQDKSS